MCDTTLNYKLLIHEIKNPLSNLQIINRLLYDIKTGTNTVNDANTVNTVNDNSTSTEYNNLLQLMQSSILQINNILQNYELIMEIDNVENSTLTPNVADKPLTHNANINTKATTLVNINNRLNQLIKLYHYQIQKNHVHIQLNSSDCIVYINMFIFDTIISNILSNAIKYTRNNIVRITVKYLNSKLEVQIRDLGIGMSMAELPNLGKPFYRAKRIESDGTGLGWVIIKKLCKLAKVDLQIKSKLGKGTIVKTTFDVSK